MTRSLPALYPIFDNCQMIEMALKLGVRMIQIRIKNQPDDFLKNEINNAFALCKKVDAILVVNDYWRIAIDHGYEFVHLGQEDLDTADVSLIRKLGIKLGISTHSYEELDRALSFDPDYIALGPIYKTIFKEMKFDPQGLEKITEWKRIIGNIPLVAIGGMTVERAKGALDAGADIVSVVTDITLNPNPEDRIRQWMEITKIV